MKKNLILFLIMLCLQLNVIAKQVPSLYVVKDTDTSSYLNTLAHKLLNMTIKDNVLYDNGQSFSYIKLYQDGKNLNVFTVVEDNKSADYEALLKSFEYKTYKLNDIDLTKTYFNEYKQFIYTNNIPLKVTNNNKYNPYSKELKNKVIRTTTYNENGLEFTTNKLELRTKIKKYAYGYEIVITNNTCKNLVLKSVNTGDFIGLTEIAKKGMKLTGTDFIPIYGVVAGAKADLEKNRFTRPFPTDYQLAQNSSVRILGLADTLVEPIIDFIFTIDGKEQKIQLHTYK